MFSEQLKERMADETGTGGGAATGTAPVTMMAFEANSYIDNAPGSRRNSITGRRKSSVSPPKPAPPPDEGEISSADAFRIGAFKRLMNRKTQVFEDPSLQQEMRKNRGYKDNKIVASLVNHHAGFVNRSQREGRLESMDASARNAYLGRQSVDFTPCHRPKFLDFTNHTHYSSKIEKIPR
jgi:hypothetical protein